MSKCHRYIRHIHDILKLYICTAITINIKVCIAGMHGGDVSHGDYSAPLPVGNQCSLYNAVKRLCWQCLMKLKKMPTDAREEMICAGSPCREVCKA